MQETNSNQIMRECPSWPGYFANSAGHIFSMRGPWKRELRQLWPASNGGGYLVVKLKIKGIWKKVRVHHMVLDAFVGPRPQGKECRHLDGNKLNNRAENLRWGTSAENMKDRDEHGRTACGENNGSAKLTWLAVEKIRAQYGNGREGLRLRDLAERFAVSESCISRIIKGTIWRRLGELSCQDIVGLA